MPSRTATCSCQQLSLMCEGEPVRVSMCHCLACQRRTGSAFGLQARFARESVRIAGAGATWTRTGDEGGQATYHFCPTCGATVYYEADWMPGFVAVAIGAFADPTFPPPTIGVYRGRRHPWIETPSIPIDYPYD